MNINTVIDELKSSPEVILYPAATQQQLHLFEEKTGLKLPVDLRAFYLHSNGFEGINDLFRIIPLEEVLEKWSSRTNLTADQFDFAEYLIYADVWHIEISRCDDDVYSIFYINPEEEEKKVPITSSLAEFISHFLAGGVYEQNGLYDWMKSVAPRLRLFF